MKAAVYFEVGDPEVLRYEDVAEPQLRPGGLLIDVRAIAIQGGDTLNRRGGILASRPHIVGFQASGIVRRGNQCAGLIGLGSSGWALD